MIARVLPGDAPSAFLSTTIRQLPRPNVNFGDKVRVNFDTLAAFNNARAVPTALPKPQSLAQHLYHFNRMPFAAQSLQRR